MYVGTLWRLRRCDWKPLFRQIWMFLYFSNVHSLPDIIFLSNSIAIPIYRYRNNSLSNLFILLGSLNNPDLKSLQFVIVCSYLSLTDSFEAPIISRISKIQRRLQTWNQWLSSESCGLNICLIVKISPRTFAYSSSRVILFVLHEKYWMLIAVPINRHQNVKKVSFFRLHKVAGPGSLQILSKYIHSD